MRRLTTILCLTLAVILGIAGDVWSANYQKGQEAFLKKDFATTLREWTPLAERGNTDAQTNLGQMYYYGRGVPRDYKTAARWYRLAAKLTIIEQQDIGLIETGLRPRFPSNVDCEGISSPFGSRTRYDGSARVSRSNNGYHGGMDISLKIGTPLLAAADGRLIHKGTGGRLTGHVIWIQHSPKDTGLGLWTYTKYKHLNKLPDMAIGTRLKMGDIVGTSGNTGTTGGYFKQFGYPHLHMNVYSSTNNKYRTRKHKVKIKNRGYVDPVAFYRNGAINSHQVRILSKREKIINIGVKLLSGKITPENSKRIWPVNCKMNEE